METQDNKNNQQQQTQKPDKETLKLNLLYRAYQQAMEREKSKKEGQAKLVTIRPDITDQDPRPENR